MRVSHRSRLPSLLVALCLWGCSSTPPETSEIGPQLNQLSLELATWKLLSLPQSATSRAFQGYAYDDLLGAGVVFGGRAANDAGASYSDCGLATSSTWSQLSASYAPRGYVSGAFDSARLRVVSYGGADRSILGAANYYADTWEFDSSKSRWTRVYASSPPGQRSSYGLAYDSLRMLTVLFGGFDGLVRKDDLWEWNGDSWAKGCSTGPCASAARPPARALPVFVFDAARGVTVLFGGVNTESVLDDTWTWDGARWTRARSTVSPSPRAAAAATYDPLAKRILIFGGVAADGHELSDLWSWDGSSWTSVAQTTTPVARQGAGMAWDSRLGGAVLFGGSSAGRPTDAWALTAVGPCSTSVKDCQGGSCGNGMCGGASSSGGAGGAAGNSGSWSAGGSLNGGTSSGGAASPTGGYGGASVDTSDSGATNMTGDGAGMLEPSSGGSVSTGNDSGAPATASGGTNSHAHDGERQDASAQKSFYSCAVSKRSPRRPWQPGLISLAVLACGWRRIRRRKPR